MEKKETAAPKQSFPRIKKLFGKGAKEEKKQQAGPQTAPKQAEIMDEDVLRMMAEAEAKMKAAET